MPDRPSDLIIRPPQFEDAPALHALWTLPGCMWGTMQLPTQTLEQARARLERWNADADMHGFLAELQGVVVGSAGLHVNAGKRRHTGSIGIMVHDDHTGRGIGRALMVALLDVADNYLGLKRVELEVITDNEPGIHLYKSLGFDEEGVKRQSILRGGVLVDTLMMGRLR